MISARSALRRSFAGNVRQRGIQQSARRKQYSTAKQTTSSSIPWILSAVAITAGGIWFTMSPSKATDLHSPHHIESKAKKHKAQSPEGEKKNRTHKDVMDSMAADRPKPEHGGSSVLNHGKAAENNEQKLRKGIFSGKEFDNHVAKHSRDPGKDFEFIEKKEAEGPSK